MDKKENEIDLILFKWGEEWKTNKEYVKKYLYLYLKKKNFIHEEYKLKRLWFLKLRKVSSCLRA